MTSVMQYYMQVFLNRKPPPDPYKAVANGNSKKKNNKENYWIKQDQMELEPCVKKDDLVASTIPRYSYLDSSCRLSWISR